MSVVTTTCIEPINNNTWYNPGRGFLTRNLWHFVNAIFLQCLLNGQESFNCAAGTTIARDTEPYMIYAGNPAVAVKERNIRNSSF